MVRNAFKSNRNRRFSTPPRSRYRADWRNFSLWLFRSTAVLARPSDLERLSITQKAKLDDFSTQTHMAL
jgi:hypothetical protein